MNVTVFGATGAIGQLTVAELLDRGHTVTAYVRNPQKIPLDWENRVRTVVGELSDEAAVRSAVAGADTVVSALGPSMARTAKGLPLVSGTRNILDAMHEHGVRRYIGHGTPSVLDPSEDPTTQTRLISLTARMFLARAYAEMLGMAELIMNSGVDWTIIRFTAPKNTPRQGRLRVGFYGTDRIGFAVSRSDIAVFTASQVEDPAYIGRAPAISN